MRSRQVLAVCLLTITIVAPSVAQQQLTSTTPLPISVAGSRSKCKAMAEDGAGGVVALYNRDVYGFPTALYVGRSLDGGESWEPLVTLFEETASSKVEDAALASDGTAFVAVWPVGANPFADEYGEMIFARSTDVGATWSPPASLSLTTIGNRTPVRGTTSSFHKSRYLSWPWQRSSLRRISVLGELPSAMITRRKVHSTWTIASRAASDGSSAMKV